MMYKQKPPAFTKLRRFLDGPPPRTQAEFGDSIDVPQQTVSSWVHEKARPSAHRRKTIELVTDGFIKEDDWLTLAERATSRRAARRATAASHQTEPPAPPAS
jgi:hypothetical protein